jgi:hypothetical protein
MQTTAKAGRLVPVVRTHSTPASSRRFPKGTGPVGSRPTAPMATMSDETEPSLRVGDRTTPGIALPPAARAVQLPSLKRRNVTR